jgi:ABC-type dipeptide/oligopeptide/nickel transport system ATPase component
MASTSDGSAPTKRSRVDVDHSPFTVSESKLAALLILVVGHSGSGKSLFINKVISHFANQRTKIACVINDSPITNIDPHFMNIRSSLKSHGYPAPLVLKGGGCVCCEGGGDMLHDAMTKALSSINQKTILQPDNSSICSSSTASSTTAEDGSSSFSGVSSNTSTTTTTAEQELEDRRILIVELNANTSLTKLPKWLSIEFSKQTTIIALANLNYIRGQLTSRIKPFGAMDSTASLTFQQVFLAVYLFYFIFNFFIIILNTF